MRALTSPFAGPMRRRDAERLAGVLKALADPTRLQLLALLSECNSTTSELVGLLGRLKQPTVSHHLGVLERAGLVERSADGRYVWYSLTPAGLTAVADALRPEVRR
jgi:ArsR family transcriptional regulator